MKIQYSEWNDGINLKKDRINIIEFDNGAAFYLFCQRILNFETIEDYFYISDGISKQCKIQSILEVIINLFQIDFNDKKILTSFYKKIVKEWANDSKVVKGVEDIGIQIKYIVEKVISNVNYPLSYDNSTSLSELIKFVGLKFNFNKSTPLGMLTSYLELLREYTFVSIVFIPYINTILNDSEINELIVFAEKINFYIIGCTWKEKTKQVLEKIIDEEQDDIDVIL